MLSQLKQHLPAPSNWRQLLKRYWPQIILAILPLAILLPILSRGFILHFDMVFAPTINLGFDAAQTGLTAYNLPALNVFLWVISLALPVDILQKIILYFIFSIGGISVFQVLSKLSLNARFISAIMYIYNPFVYDRFLAGHWRFLIAYSITPFFAYVSYRLLARPSRSRLASTIAWGGAIMIISSHHVIILGILFATLTAALAHTKRQLLYSLSAVIGFLLVNSWWIIPTVTAQNFTGAFDLSHLLTFATRLDHEHGLLFNMISLQGFWFNGWTSLKDIWSFWPLLTIIWLLPVGLGIGAGWKGSKQARRFIIAGTGLLIVSFTLAAGLSPNTDWLNGWIFENIPGMKGLREPQKMLSLVALTYSFTAAIGINELHKNTSKQISYSVTSLLLIVNIFIAWPFLWGAHGQIKTTDYPQSWYQARQIINKDPGSKAIVLPWSLYTSSTIVDDVVVQPAQSFFGSNVIVSRNSDLRGISDWAPDIYQTLGESIESENFDLFNNTARDLNAEYIIITERKDSISYEWLTGKLTRFPQADSDLELYRLTD